MPRRSSFALLRPCALLITLVAAGCGGGVAGAFGATPAAARADADGFFSGLALRFDDVDRAPRFAAARDKMSKYALTPARLIRDDSIWTSGTAQTARYLEVEGRHDGTRYRFAPRAGAPSPTRPGEGRHVIRLAPLGDDAFQWNTIVEHGVGQVRAAAVTDVVTAALARFEQPAADVGTELGATLPRTAATLGRAFSLDSVRTTPVGDGSTRVDLRVGIHPERLRAAGMPAFAAYVAKYSTPTRYHLELADARGGRWLDIAGADNALTIRLRLRRGELLALDGAARPLPEQLELHTDVVTRYLMFDVGVERLVGDFTFVRTGHERGWSMRWRRAPRWRIPLGFRHLINGALNRPFAGQGMRLDLTLRDADHDETLLVRRFDVAVQESAVVRWLGGLGAKAMSDLAGRAEVEQDRFLADALNGMRADAAAALAR